MRIGKVQPPIAKTEFEMGALEKYLQQEIQDFDISHLIDAEVESIESTTYDSPLIYKYFDSTRRPFFTKPQLRFSQREALNDPLEMSVRWKKISTDGLRNHIAQHFDNLLPKMFADTALLIEATYEDLSDQGITLTQSQKTQIEDFFESGAGKEFIKNQIPQMRATISLGLNYIFDRFENEFQTFIDRIISKFGILSLTENPLNAQMWAHYAARGTGFVIGFNPNHPLFYYEDKNLLRKVVYTDEKTENFWRNPYYLFLVKAMGWSYEREWRCFRDLDKCDETIAAGAIPICLVNLKPETIKTVYFGYHYDPSWIESDVAALKAFGASPDFFKVQVSREKGSLELNPI